MTTILPTLRRARSQNQNGLSFIGQRAIVAARPVSKPRAVALHAASPLRSLYT